MTSFNPKVQTARKEHICWTCERPIKPGTLYITIPGINHEGAFVNTRMCVECNFIATQKDGENATTFSPGCFTELRIPNCLRKVRNDFRLDPKAAAEKYKVFEIPPPEIKTHKQIIVKSSEFDRQIFHLPESRYKRDNYPAGATITIKAGVNGKSRTTTIKGSWSTSGTGFGETSRQVAILTERAK